jgi:hypothetical protein
MVPLGSSEKTVENKVNSENILKRSIFLTVISWGN